jgi:hypothetical protein
MHHLAKVTFGKVERLPYHAECSCGTAGDFPNNERAREYLAMHLARLQGINSGAFVDETVAPLEVPKPPEEKQSPEPEQPATPPETPASEPPKEKAAKQR